jgi:hypothetical protein
MAELPTPSTNRVAELTASLLAFRQELQMASANYSEGEPPRRRAAAKIALNGAIKLILQLYPNEPSFPLPLNQLLYGLADLDRGKVVPLLEPAEIFNRPGNALSDNLFRAIAAAAMSVLMSAGGMRRAEAARDVTRQLSKLGYKRSSARPITASAVAKWREKMMTELAAEDPAVARYEYALNWVSEMEPIAAVKFLLNSLSDASPPEFPENPQA